MQNAETTLALCLCRSWPEILRCAQNDRPRTCLDMSGACHSERSEESLGNKGKNHAPYTTTFASTMPGPSTSSSLAWSSGV